MWRTRMLALTLVVLIALAVALVGLVGTALELALIHI